LQQENNLLTSELESTKILLEDEETHNDSLKDELEEAKIELQEAEATVTEVQELYSSCGAQL